MIPGAFERDLSRISELAACVHTTVQIIHRANVKDKQRLRDKLVGQLKDYNAAVRELAEIE